MSTAAEEPARLRVSWFWTLLIGLLALQILFALWWVNRPTMEEVVRKAGGRFHSGADSGTWIDLSNSRVNDAWLSAQHGRLGSLTTVALELRNCPISGAGLQALNGMENINNIDLTGTTLTDADCQHLAALPSLVVLQIGHTRISDVGLNVLAKLPMLNAVTIDRTQATPPGAAALAKCTRLRGVTLLDADTRSVAALRGLALFGFGLRAERLDSSCLPVLKQFTGLKNLMLYDSHFTDIELEGLRQALPECRIQQTPYSTVTEAIETAWQRAKVEK